MDMEMIAKSIIIMTQRGSIVNLVKSLENKVNLIFAYLT
jgi:hypothetical protein